MPAATVLLIDPDPDSLNIYTLVLEHHGFAVRSTASSEHGFQMACDVQPDLVVMEPFAADVRGQSLADLLRVEARTAHLRVLMITAVPAAAEGRVGCLVKPCQPRRFLEEVQRRLELVPLPQ